MVAPGRSRHLPPCPRDQTSTYRPSYPAQLHFSISSPIRLQVMSEKLDLTLFNTAMKKILKRVMDVSRAGE
jgi:hypothetical protein